MKELFIFISFTPKEIELVGERMKNRSPSQEYLGFWSGTLPGYEEKIADHISATVNYFLNTDKKEIYFGCDEADLDRILSKIETEHFDVTVVSCDEFQKQIKL